MFSNFKWSHALYVILGLVLIVLQWVQAQNASGTFQLSAQIIAGVATALTVAKTLQGLLQASTNPAANAKAVAKVAAAATSMLAMVVMAVCVSGCLSSAPLVPITPDNTAQISSCENTATLHNGFLIGGFVVTGAAGGLGAAGALASDPQTKTDLAIGGTIAAGAAVLATSLVAMSSSNYASNKCSAVIGPLPVAAPKPAGAAQ